VDKFRKNLKLHIAGSLVVLAVVMTIIVMVFCTNTLAAGGSSTAVPKETEAKATTNNGTAQFALIAAAAAFGLGALGAGYAISHVGAAAMGAIAEKPQIAGQALIFVALAEGIVVFGFITALMILGKM
jgi:V/A-type H+/Na+-transporting ATPase subunit K